jgi:hypothetical protein
MTDFTSATYHNPWLTPGANSVDAVVRVTASGASTVAHDTSAAEIIIIDVSGSMGKDRKLHSAKAATAAAIDALRDGTRFAVVAGQDYATTIFPLEPDLVPANAETRAEAKRLVADLRAGGGTAIGQWLCEAERWFDADPQTIRHAILLTDGQNQNETKAELDDALNACTGRFQCDCRGVGTDWDVDELQRIASHLLGTVDIICAPADMEAEFRAMTEAAMGKMTADVTLHVWTPAGATVEFVKQVKPEVLDLTDRRRSVSELVGEYPTGAWGNESRDYHVRIGFAARGVGEEMLAARISLDVGSEKVSQALVTVSWTNDLGLSTKVVAEVEHYVAQEEGISAIREGLAALEAGELEVATDRLVRAREIAMVTGNLQRVEEIEKLIDPVTGTVRLHADKADKMTLLTRSVKTTRIPGRQ